MKLELLLKIPSIRTQLDNWLKNSEFGGKSKFENNLALGKMERLILKLNDDYGVPFEIGFQIVTDSAEAIMEELYN